MKRILLLFFIIIIFFIYGCGKEETAPTGNIVVSTYKVEEPEVVEDVADIEEESENITTVRLCHDTDSGIIKFVNGTIFGFYSNATGFEFTDYCISNNYLMEFYCENKTALQKVFFCRHGCVDGHCA